MEKRERRKAGMVERPTISGERKSSPFPLRLHPDALRRPDDIAIASEPCFVTGDSPRRDAARQSSRSLAANGKTNGSTRIAANKTFVVRVDLREKCEVVVQFLTSSPRIGFQMMLRDSEVGEGLRVINGGKGQVGGELVRAGPGPLRIRWDNSYRGTDSQVRDATIKYVVEWKPLGQKPGFNGPNEKKAPRGSALRTRMVSYDDAPDSPVRDDECLLS